MNETETYWACSQRGFFALFYYLILMKCGLLVYLVMCPFFAIYKSINEARKKKDYVNDSKESKKWSIPKK